MSMAKNTDMLHNIFQKFPWTFDFRMSAVYHAIPSRESNQLWRPKFNKNYYTSRLRNELYIDK